MSKTIRRNGNDDFDSRARRAARYRRNQEEEMVDEFPRGSEVITNADYRYLPFDGNFPQISLPFISA